MNDAAVARTHSSAGKTRQSQPSPTREQYEAYEELVCLLNDRIFDGRCSIPMLTLGRHGQKAPAIFVPREWQRGSETCHLISVLPEAIRIHPPRELAAWICRALVDLYLYEVENRKRLTYKNGTWAALMLDAGFVPTDTGAEGGKPTGYKVQHRIKDDGAFAAAFAERPIAIPWRRHMPEPGSSRSEGPRKATYLCRHCGKKRFWARPQMPMICPNCIVLSDEEGKDSRQLLRIEIVRRGWNLASRPHRAAFLALLSESVDGCVDGDALAAAVAHATDKPGASGTGPKGAM